MSAFALQDAFPLFDKRGNGRIAISDVGDLLRAVGRNPTLAEISELQRELQAVHGSDMTRASFEQVLADYGRTHNDSGHDNVDDYVQGFEVFDKDHTGFIEVGQLKYVLTCLGEKLTQDEADELLKSFDVSGNKINYREFVETIMAN